MTKYLLLQPSRLITLRFPQTPPPSSALTPAPLPCSLLTAGEALVAIRREISAMDVQVRVAQTHVSAHLHRRSGAAGRGDDADSVGSALDDDR
jgi:hypothetical protein